MKARKKAFGSSMASSFGQGRKARPDASTITPASHRLKSAMLCQTMAKAAGSVLASTLLKPPIVLSLITVPSRSSSFKALCWRRSLIDSR